MSTSKTFSPPVPAASSFALTSESLLLLGMGGYFLARAVVRTLVSDTPEWDEAEQLIQTQLWSWGYGPQPPLYTWVQKLFFMGLGTNVFALALLKALLLFGTCALSFLVGKEASGDRRVGVVSALSLFLIPQFVWASQVDLTHSNMGMFFTVATVLLTVRLLQQRTSWRYLCLGAAAAAGVLSKYNYVVLLVVLLVALCSWPEGRRILCDKRFVLSVTVLILLLAPHLNWIWHNHQLATGKIPNLVSPAKLSWIRAWLGGFGALAMSLLMYVVPLFACWTIVLGRLPTRAELWPTNDSERRAILFRRLLGFSLLLYVAAIFVLRARFKERWIQPNMYAVPMVFALGLAAELSNIRLRRFATLAGAAAVAVFLLLAGRVLLAGTSGRPMRVNMPFRELAAKLKRGGIQPATIIAESSLTGAAFRFEFPEAPVLVPGQLAVPRRAGPQLVIWKADCSASAREQLRRLAIQRGIPREAFAQAGVVEAPLKYFASRKLTMNYFLASSSPDPAP